MTLPTVSLTSNTGDDLRGEDANAPNIARHLRAARNLILSTADAPSATGAAVGDHAAPVHLLAGAAPLNRATVSSLAVSCEDCGPLETGVRPFIPEAP